MEKFRIALFQMNSNKSLVHDGLNPAFFYIYKKIIHLCGLEVFHYDITWLETGLFPPKVNATTIVLISKIKSAMSSTKSCPKF